MAVVTQVRILVTAQFFQLSIQFGQFAKLRDSFIQGPTLHALNPINLSCAFRQHLTLINDDFDRLRLVLASLSLVIVLFLYWTVSTIILTIWHAVSRSAFQIQTAQTTRVDVNNGPIT